MKKDTCDVTVVGGLPRPVGGVTSFVSRLAAQNMVSEIVDLYPSAKKIIPTSYLGRVVFVKGLVGFLFYYWRRMFYWRGRLVHFNFSRARSVLILFFLPKFGAKFAFMLHHGELSFSRFGFLYKFAFSRVDLFFCMTSQQEGFYRGFAIPESKIVRVSSYVPPSKACVDRESRAEVDSFFEGGRVFVASGFPKGIYNHEWCVQYVLEHVEYKLALFIYGDGDLKERLLESVSECDRLNIYFDCDQDLFNYAISKCFIYLRPASTDSFGVAVADAVEMGVQVLASDVCKRYPGALLFSLSDYEAFCRCLDAVITGQRVRVETSDDFYPFLYPDMKILGFKKEEL